MKKILFFSFLAWGLFTNIIAADLSSTEKTYEVIGRAFSNKQVLLKTKSGQKHMLYVSSFVMASLSLDFFQKMVHEDQTHSCLIIDDIDDKLLPSYIAIIYLMHHHDYPANFSEMNGTPLHDQMIKSIDEPSTLKLADDLICDDVINDTIAEGILKKLSVIEKIRFSAACCFYYYFLTR